MVDNFDAALAKIVEGKRLAPFAQDLAHVVRSMEDQLIASAVRKSGADELTPDVAYGIMSQVVALRKLLRSFDKQVEAGKTAGKVLEQMENH